MMGYWGQHPDGTSFFHDSDLLWGDRPADILDEALRRVVDGFTEDVGRPPTKAEIRAGLEFSLHVWDDPMTTPERVDD